MLRPQFCLKQCLSMRPDRLPVSGLIPLCLLPLISKALFFLPKTVMSIVVIFAMVGTIDLKAWPR
eukprot:SAG22_NODE_3436_length_1713_cov_1.796778_3_plen_65_part_00